MGTIRQIYKPLLCIALTLISLQAARAETGQEPANPLNFIGRFDFDWNDIWLGSLELGVSETPDAYTLRLEVKSEGIIKLFTQHRDETTATGTRKGGLYLPQHYLSHYMTKNKPRLIEFAYDDKGAMTLETVVPPEDRTERPEVPHSLKDGSLDPLSGFLAIRADVMKWRGFDGKHLYEVHVEKGDPTPVVLPGGMRAGIPYTLTRTPLAGMTEKEMRTYAKGEAPLTLYFSTDARHIPLGMRLPLYGLVRGRLIKECTKWEDCRIP